MLVRGYVQINDGQIYPDTIWNYMSLDYYPHKKLKGKKRILLALSKYLKNDIPIGLFSYAYTRILADERRKKDEITGNSLFSDDVLADLNIGK